MNFLTLEGISLCFNVLTKIIATWEQFQNLSHSVPDPEKRCHDKFVWNVHELITLGNFSVGNIDILKGDILTH